MRATGIRPLFYNITEDIFSFASEIKALFRLKHIERALDLKHLSQVYTFWTAITPGTAFKGIYELSPGHFAVFSRDRLEVTKYWDLEPGKACQSIRYLKPWNNSTSCFQTQSDCG